MGKIQVLSELVANKIAAGEVVERPASVVKELIENSLDAGAKNISVSIRHGGKSLIRVRDDGLGMDTEDAQACLIRHSTSKISDVEDIEKIETLGFRGEAIPSIAAVSRFTMTTRQQADDTATVVKVSGGMLDSVKETVSDPGTLIEVADLFFNIPARKKFLKSDAAEYNGVTDIFNTLCLACKEVSFTLNRNDVEAAKHPACHDLLERIKQLYSPEFSERLYPIAVTKPDFRLAGYIGAPDNTRVNRTGQKFFINSRPVLSPSLSMALGRAYEEFLQQRRFPVAILFLEIERSFVDVNVHPAKKEVRIRTERFFQDIVVNAVKTLLRRKGFYLDERTTQPEQGFSPQAQYQQLQASPVSFQRLKEATAPWKPGSQTAGSSQDKTSYKSIASEHTPQNFQAALYESEPTASPLGIVKVLGQILGTYILAEAEDGFAVFDQHAAHERIIYEEIIDSLEKGPSASQKIIFPVTLHLDLQEAPQMEKYLQDFQRTGFNINCLGGGTFSIDAVPVCMSDTDAERTIKDTLHELLDSRRPRTRESRQHELAAILACKSHSVKAGRQLDVQEMEHLIQRLGAKKNPHTCPHGRPSFFIITKDEIEKKFKRK